MDAVYFTKEGGLAKESFDLYRRGPNKDLLTPIQGPMGSGSVSHKEYDATVKSYKDLPSEHRSVLSEQAKHRVLDRKGPSPIEKLTPEARKGFLGALGEHNIDASRSTLDIVHDHISGGTQRAEGVFNVGGHPVRQSSMDPKIISFYKGGNLSEVDRFTDLYGRVKNEQELATGLQRLTKVPAEQAIKTAQSSLKVLSETPHIKLPGVHGVHGGFAGILAAGAAGMGLTAMSGTASASEIVGAGARAAADSAVPGIGDGFQGVAGNKETTLGKVLNTLDTVTGTVATGAAVAAPFTGGASLTVAAVAGGANIAVNLAKDGAHALGLTKEGGLIEGVSNVASAVQDKMKVAGRPTSSFAAMKGDQSSAVPKQSSAENLPPSTNRFPTAASLRTEQSNVSAAPKQQEMKTAASMSTSGAAKSPLQRTMMSPS